MRTYLHFYTRSRILLANLYACAIHAYQVQSPQAHPNML